MSTKIFNAFRMEASSLDEVINKIFIEKKNIIKDIENKLIKDVLLEMIQLYDKFSLESLGLQFDENEQENLNTNVHSIIMDKLWRKNNENIKEKEVSIIIYPESINHFNKKNYLMQIYAEEAITKIMTNKYFKKWNLEEYNYWNNTDQPDTITDYEWNLRKENWEKIDIPILSGVSITLLNSSKYEIFNSYGCKEQKDIVKNILNDLNKEYNLEKRIEKSLFKVKEKIAYEECYDNFIKKNNLENTENSVLEDIMRKKGMKIYLESLDKAIENNFNENQIYQIQEKEIQIKNLLKKDFIIEDFQTEIKQLQNNKILCSKIKKL